MRFRTVFAAVAALSLLASGGAAIAQSASSLSLAASAGVQEAPDANELGGRRGGMGWILGLVAVGMLVFVVLELQDDNDLPDSP